MKREVEKQLPDKVEHIVQCNLSRRQRLLYDEYINSDKTKSTLYDSSDFFSIMNVLMQLRKVCNHPDLFEARTIESPFIMQERVQMPYPSLMYKDLLIYHPMSEVNLQNLNFILSDFESMSRTEYQSN
jgi:E1A-binding protein p400